MASGYSVGASTKCGWAICQLNIMPNLHVGSYFRGINRKATPDAQ